MSDLVGDHIVGFPTRRLILLHGQKQFLQRNWVYYLSPSFKESYLCHYFGVYVSVEGNESFVMFPQLQVDRILGNNVDPGQTFPRRKVLQDLVSLEFL